MDKEKKTHWQLKLFVGIGGSAIVLTIVAIILAFFGKDTVINQSYYFDISKSEAADCSVSYVLNNLPPVVNRPYSFSVNFRNCNGGDTIVSSVNSQGSNTLVGQFLVNSDNFSRQLSVQFTEPTESGNLVHFEAVVCQPGTSSGTCIQTIGRSQNFRVVSGTGGSEDGGSGKEDGGDKGDGDGSGDGSGIDDLPGVDLTIDDVYNFVYGLACWLWSISMFLIVIALIWVGIRMMISQANATAFSAAKTAFVHVLVGAIVIMGVYVIIATVANFVGADISLIPFSCDAGSDFEDESEPIDPEDEELSCQDDGDCSRGETCFFGRCEAQTSPPNSPPNATRYQLCGSSAVSGNAGDCITSSDCSYNYCYDASGSSVCGSTEFPSDRCRRDKNGNPIP